MNITGHFKTITRHRHLVMKNCFKAGIPVNGLLHDLSKYSPAEFIPGIMNYEEGKRSPNEAYAKNIAKTAQVRRKFRLHSR